MLVNKRSRFPKPLVVAFVLMFFGAWLLYIAASKERSSRMRDADLAVTAMSAQAKDLFVAEFAKMKYERAAPYNAPMQPATVFEGASSTILHIGAVQARIEHPDFVEKLKSKVLEPERAQLLFNSNTIFVPALARTSRGRYFLTGYAFIFESPASCLEPARCGRLDGPKDVSIDEAKAWVFRDPSATPADYERIFGEAMPPRHVPA